MIPAIFAYSGFKQATQPPKPKGPETRILKVNKLKIDAIPCINLSLQLTSDLIYLGNDWLHSLSEKSRVKAWGYPGDGEVCEILLRQSFPKERNVIILLKHGSSGFPCDEPGTERPELLFRGVGHKQFSLKSMRVITAQRKGSWHVLNDRGWWQKKNLEKGLSLETCNKQAIFY